MNYTVILEKESVGGYHVFCPALKGCHSEGETEAEALQNIREAIDVCLESLAAHNEPIPQEDIVIRSIPGRSLRQMRSCNETGSDAVTSTDKRPDGGG